MTFLFTLKTFSGAIWHGKLCQELWFIRKQEEPDFLLEVEWGKPTDNQLRKLITACKSKHIIWLTKSHVNQNISYGFETIEEIAYLRCIV